MQVSKAELLHRTNLILGEGAHWHRDWGKLLYVDIEGEKVGCIDPVTKVTAEKKVGKKIGAVVPATNGSLIVALKGSIEELDFRTGKRRKLVDVEPNMPGNRCNDGKCDVEGRFWIGTMDEYAEPELGALYCFDGSLNRKLKNVSVSNGICWTEDNSTMYYIDSLLNNIRAYGFKSATGDIFDERVVVVMEEAGCIPDGMTIDNEGMLWVAMWGGGCVNRYDPVSGKLIGKITVEAPNVTSCAFGGPDMDQLFITTATTGLDKAQLAEYPLSGSLFSAFPGVMGRPMYPYCINERKNY